MYPPHSSQRPGHRQIPGDDGDNTVSKPQQSASGATQSQATGMRSSSASTNASQQPKKANPGQQLSQIEKSVTHLLVATKQLLETLTQWSQQAATENEVSDVYVRLGYEFNIACRAFNAIGVDTQDLGPVPDLLRSILEDTLSQEASRESLDKYLPRIRDIIINLLHGLKKKQSKLRQRAGREGGAPSASATRQGSVASTVSADSAGAAFADPDASAATAPSVRQPFEQGAQRQASSESNRPPHTPSASGSSRGTSQRHDGRSTTQNDNRIRSTGRESPAAVPTGTFPEPSTATSTSTQSTPFLPYPQEQSMPPYPTSGVSETRTYPPMAYEPPKRDALATLQRSGELERRASRRFSAYHISKHLGAASNGVNMLPSQSSPVPNRGRDARESMNAVRVRGSPMYGRTRSANQAGNEKSPNRKHTVIESRISEEPSIGEAPSELPPPPVSQVAEVHGVTTAEDKLGLPPLETTAATHSHHLVAGDLAVRRTPPDTSTVRTPQTPQPNEQASSIQRKKSGPPSRLGSKRRNYSPSSQASQDLVDQSPQPGKPLVLFLQYRSKIKKIVLPDGSDELSVARLQLAFIEKFAWNTHGDGTDLPEIYMQDPVSGVRHELEDLSDIKDRSVLVLNIEPLDEVKRHIDDGLGGIRRVIEDVKAALSDQQSTLQRVSERQTEAAKELSRFTTVPPPSLSVGLRDSTLPPSSKINGDVRFSNIKGKAGQMDEIASLRRDLAVMRQTFTTFTSEVQNSMSTIRTKAASIKTVAADSSVPLGESGRTYVNTGKASLSADSEKIVNRVDDLQDTVEDLRKDVVSRGVRPLPRQLESVSKDIAQATTELKKMQEFLRREKPTWTKIWEKELQVVCDDRDLLTMQEELAADLEDDLEKAASTFALVEEACRQQNLQSQKDGNDGKPSSRNTSRSFVSSTTSDQAAVDPRKAKDGVLGEVRALRPNHETRLEAIERAEKARLAELEDRRGGEFQKELGNFVEEGRLKKTGGVEEAERQRLKKEELARREVWERTNAVAGGGGAGGRSTSAPVMDGSRSPRKASSNPGETAVEGGETTDGRIQPIPKSPSLPLIGATSATPTALHLPKSPPRPVEDRDTPTTPEPEFVEAKEALESKEDLPGKEDNGALPAGSG